MEVYPTEVSKPVFTTTVNFYSDGAATQVMSFLFGSITMKNRNKEFDRLKGTNLISLNIYTLRQYSAVI